MSLTSLAVHDPPACGRFAGDAEAVLRAAGWLGGEPTAAPLLHVMPDLDDAGLRQALAPPGCGCLVVCRDWQRLGDLLVPPPSGLQRLFCLLPARLAYSLPVAEALVRAVEARIDADLGLAELAIHEALANSVLHGALGIGHAGLEGAADMSPHNQLVATALDDRNRGAMPVMVRVSIRPAAHENPVGIDVVVADTGGGFSPEAAGAHAGTTLFGRGITLMKTVATSIGFDDGGRRTLLSFPGLARRESDPPA